MALQEKVLTDGVNGCYLDYTLPVLAGGQDGPTKAKGSEGGASPRARCPQPTPGRRDGSALRLRRVLRSSGHRSGEVRDGEKGPGGGRAGQPLCGFIRILPPIFLCSEDGLCPRWAARSCAEEARTSRSTQTQRRGPRLRIDFAQGGCHPFAGTGRNEDRETIRNQSSPTKRPAGARAPGKKTTVTPIDAPDVSRSEKEEAVALYEKLRRTALGEDGDSSVHTYTLFINRGMAAWVKAWTEFVDATSNQPPARGSS